MAALRRLRDRDAGRAVLLVADPAAALDADPGKIVVSVPERPDMPLRTQPAITARG